MEIEGDLVLVCCIIIGVPLIVAVAVLLARYMTHIETMARCV